MPSIIDYVFVILVYRNTQDLIECIESIKKNVDSYKVIVVNAFYDDVSENNTHMIANQYGCDYINVPNNGYSYGNNAGIQYANTKYKYRYAVVSNPDIVIKRMPSINVNADIIAPMITSASGKAQNPMYYSYNSFTDRLIYLGFKKSKISMVISGLTINHCVKTLQQILHGKKSNFSIYAAHGSFVLISQKALQAFNNEPYDTGIFLFAEEMVLAARAKEKGLKTIYTTEISVYHKEDGSMSLGDVSVDNELAKGNIYYYEHYKMKK